MKKGLTRRDFGKTTALSATAMAGFSLLKNAHAAAGPMKIGVIGCGGRGTGAVQNAIQANDQIELVAVCDVFEDRAKGAVDQFKKNENLAKNIKVEPENIFWDLDGYKKLLQLDMDYVILATPPGFRPEHFEAVVAAKKNCFCEKPIAVDPNGTRRFMAAAKKSEEMKLHIVTGTQRRHQLPYVETIKKIHDGVLGDIVGGRAYWDGTLPHARDRKAGMSDLEYQLYNWYNFCWICGDNIVEQHVHNLDIMNWVFQSHPVAVIASGGRAWKPKIEKYGNIWDHFSCDFIYPNDVHVMSFSRHWNNSYNEVSELIFGTKKGPNGFVSNCCDMASGGRNPYVQEHADLQASIAGEGPYLNEAMQVAESVFTAIIGRMAAYSGKKLSWDEALNMDLDIVPKGMSWDKAMPPAPIPVPGA
ncbi:MAG: Gfo/Idh/MocA family oxidoreductase [Candidatus Omnitrophica bacterium]|nr:Gfo/Idh/MocA family oxidoreductase [Candidatus Omnitrophota bacterium]